MRSASLYAGRTRVRLGAVIRWSLRTTGTGLKGERTRREVVRCGQRRRDTPEQGRVVEPGLYPGHDRREDRRSGEDDDRDDDRPPAAGQGRPREQQSGLDLDDRPESDRR